MEIIESEFEHITFKEGLPNLRIDCILQDCMGYLWFGTKRGLCKYNGYSFEVFKSNSRDTASLRYHQISCLLEDKDSVLWIGTWFGGLHKYNRQLNNFERFHGTNDYITELYQDSEGFIWIGTEQGLFKYDKQKNVTASYQFTAEDGYSPLKVSCILENGKDLLVSISKLGILKYDPIRDAFSPLLLLRRDINHYIGEINQVYKFNQETFWLGTDQGLFVYDLKQNKITHRFSDIKKVSISSPVRFIVEESYNTIWIGADGLYKYDIVNGLLRHIKHDHGNPQSLSNDYVTCGYIDSQQNKWFGTYASGLNVIYNNPRQFNKYSHINRQLDTLSRNISAIAIDENEQLWLGSWDKGLLVFGKNQEKIDLYENFPQLKNLENYNIRTIEIDKNDNIWIGSSSRYLTLVNKKNNVCRFYNTDTTQSLQSAHPHIVSLYCDEEEKIWVGTDNRGLLLFDSKKERFIPFKNQNLLFNSTILDIEKDKEGNIFIATYGQGLHQITKDGELKRYSLTDISENNLPISKIITIYRDSHDNIWFGTEFQGLIKLSPDKVLTRYSISEGLTNNEICSILEDNVGQLWIATSEGLLRFHERKGTLKYYYWRDGLITDEFNYNAVLYGNNNTMYFGGTDGLVFFDPGSITENLYKPPVYLEHIYLDNKEVKIQDPGSPLQCHLSFMREIILKHNQNVLTFEFAALNYIAPQKNEYAYVLEGFADSEWNYIGNNRSVTFTNLDHGYYILRVKASNNDGIWNDEEARLSIRVLTPPWLKWWAFLIYSIIFSFVTYGTLSILRQQIRLRQQIKMQNYDKEKQAELTNMKLQFFTNISHEFKTPLSLIISPLEEIISNFKGSNETRQKLRLIHFNSNRLLSLIHLLIDFRKAEQEVLELIKDRHDLIEVTKEVIQAFKHPVSKTNKYIELRTDLPYCEFLFDRDRIERVLFNLISNSVKFTNSFDQIIIILTADTEGQKVCIEVHDTGIGIKEEDVNHVFEKFYNAHNAKNKSQNTTGSGIGLYLSKKIVELHDGTINLESAPGKGTTINITLPAPGLNFQAEEIPVVSEPSNSRRHQIMEEFESEAPPNIGESAPLVLIVEDELEMRGYLRRMLWKYYRTEEAENGKAGIEKARSILPDLIISDIMMPEMSGIEMCQQLKKDKVTDHIPIILLSAKSGMENILDGYEMGADEYLEKPFSSKHLLIRIRNLIESREKLRLHFEQKPAQKPKIAGINSYDREFLEKVFYKIEQNLSNPDFNVKELSSELGMSRVHLYRRFKNLTGKMPKEYMNEVRLKAASALLEENKLTISEVAYKVGFNTPSNFTASFKAYFGVLPKNYKSSTD